MNPLTEIKNNIVSLLQSPNPSAQDWADIMTSLQFLLSDATEQALAKEIAAMVKFKEVRAQEKTRADAEVTWKSTLQWAEWREAEERKKEIEGWKTVASRQASARYRAY
jgi:hypothetical protein